MGDGAGVVVRRGVDVTAWVEVFVAVDSTTVTSLASVGVLVGPAFVGIGVGDWEGALDVAVGAGTVAAVVAVDAATTVGDRAPAACVGDAEGEAWLAIRVALGPAGGVAGACGGVGVSVATVGLETAVRVAVGLLGVAVGFRVATERGVGTAVSVGSGVSPGSKPKSIGVSVGEGSSAMAVGDAVGTDVSVGGIAVGVVTTTVGDAGYAAPSAGLVLSGSGVRVASDSGGRSGRVRPLATTVAMPIQ